MRESAIFQVFLSLCKELERDSAPKTILQKKSVYAGSCRSFDGRARTAAHESSDGQRITPAGFSDGRRVRQLGQKRLRAELSVDKAPLPHGKQFRENEKHRFRYLKPEQAG